MIQKQHRQVQVRHNSVKVARVNLEFTQNQAVDESKQSVTRTHDDDLKSLAGPLLFRLLIRDKSIELHFGRKL